MFIRPSHLARRFAFLAALFLSLAVLFHPTAQLFAEEEDEEGEQENGDEIRLRAEWIFKQRAFPAENVPERALERALAETVEAERAQSLRPSRAAITNRALRGEVGPQPASSNAGVVSSWAGIGPAPILGSQTVTPQAVDPSLRVSGRVSAIAVDPEDSKRWLVGAAQGGIWVTEDEGKTWSPKTDSMPSLAIGAIAFAPGAPDTVYAGTGESSGGGDSYGGAGLLKSTDGGNTWAVVPDNSAALVGVCFSEIRVSPTDANTLMATTTKGGYGAGTFPRTLASVSWRAVLKSTDGGAHWQRKLPTNFSADASDIEVDPGNFNNQFAALSADAGESGTGVYRSTDAGETWALINGPWANASTFPGGMGRIELAMSPADSNVLYVSIQDRDDPPSNPPTNVNANDDSLLGIWKSIDALAPSTTHWSQLPVPTGTAQMSYNHQLLVDPTDSRVLYFGEVRAWKYDGRPGASKVWTDITRNAHADQHAIAFTGNRLLLGNDGGIYYRDDRAVNIDTTDWTTCNTNLAITQFYQGAVHPTDKNFALGGSQDNGTEQFLGNLGWKAVGYGDGGACNISNSRPATDWVISRYQLQIVRTTTGAPTATTPVRMENGIDDNQGKPIVRAPFIARVVKHPTLDDIFIAGSDNIWRCDTYFSAANPTWYKNSIDEDTGISALAFAPSDNTAKIYAYGTGGNVDPPVASVLKITQTGGGAASAWNDLNASGDVPNRYPTNLAFDPNDANTLYVTLSGFDENTPGHPGHLFRTKNALSSNPSWTDISPPVNLPNNSIVLDYSHPEIIYVGTDLGVWQGETQSDGTVTWTHFGPAQGMPNVAVFDLKFQPPTRRLFAFTHGRGAFVADLSPANDHQQDARVITGTSGRLVDTNINATLDSGEPDHYTPTPEKGEHSVWFVWQAPIGGTVEFSTIGSNFDTDLAVYAPGSSWQQVQLPAVASDNNSGGNGTSKVTFQTTAGSFYLIAVNGSAANDTGFYVLNWSVSDSTSPQVTITSPTHNAALNALTAITGTASDPSGIKDNKVTLSLRHVTSGEYWDGSSWSFSPAVITASVSGGTWTYSSPPAGSELRAGQYLLTADAQDNAGNPSAVQPTINRINFTVDTQAPEIAITSPPHGAIINGLTQIRGTASDLLGTPSLYIIRYSDGAYWTASGWASGESAILPTSYDSATKTWHSTGPLPQVGGSDPNTSMPDGDYDIVAFAYDSANNEKRTDAVISVQAFATPSVEVKTPTPGSTINGLQSISGTASSVVESVALFIFRYDDGKWWNGSQWTDGGAFALPTNYDRTNHTWSNAGALPNTGNNAATSLASGSYDIFVLGYDGNGGDPARHDSVVTVNRSLAPAVQVTAPAPGSNINVLFSISGSASSVVEGVNLYLYRYSDGKFWDGTAWGGGGSAILPIQYDRAEGMWYSVGNLPDAFGNDPNTSLTDGTYDIIAIGYDAAGGQARHDSVVNVDRTGPVLVSLVFTPDTVDVTSDIKNVAGTIRVTDAAGFSLGFITIKSPSGDREFTAVISEYERKSGTDKDGVYGFTFFLPRYLEPGAWKAKVELYDKASNFSSFGAEQMFPMPNGSPGVINVLNTAGVDHQDPVLVSLSYSPSTVDVTGAAREVTVTAVLTDDLAGIQYGSLELRSPSGQRSIYGSLDSSTRVSGTPTNGTYQFKMRIPRSVEPGTWKTQLYISDASNRNVTYDEDVDNGGTPFPSGSDGHLNVINAGGVDAADPAISNLQFSPASVDITSAAQQVTVTFQVTDDVSGLDHGFFTLVSPTGAHSTGMEFNAAQRISGTPTAGTYSFVLTIPRYAEPGTWKVSAVIFDGSDNSTGYGGYFDPPLPQTLNVVNNGAVDKQAPILTNVQYQPTHVNVANSAQQITITMYISDSPSGFHFGTVGFYAPSDLYGYGTPTQFTAAQRISGDAQAGVYQAVFTIPQNAEVGDWRLGLELDDETGNYRYYGAAYYQAEPLNAVVTVAHDNNTAPTVNAGADITATTGQNITFQGSFTDPDANDPHTTVWSFGDGGTASNTLTPVHTYTNAGAYNVTLTVTDSFGASRSDNLVVTVNPPPATIDQWEASAFPPGTPAEAKAPTADTDRDGVTVLEEYAFNMDPTKSSRDGLPILGTTTGAATTAERGTNATTTPRYLSLTYRRRIGSTDLVYIIAASANLTTWDTTQSQIEQVGPAVAVGDGQTELVTVRYNQPISSGRQFLRVIVQKQ